MEFLFKIWIYKEFRLISHRVKKSFNDEGGGWLVESFTKNGGIGYVYSYMYTYS